MAFLEYITWDADPVLFSPFGFEIRYYGVFFAFAFVFGQMIMNYIYKIENQPKANVENITLYVILGTVIGARLGHCLFYDFEEYVYNFSTGKFQNPLRILNLREGGLASHGGVAGVLLAVYLYIRKYKYTYLWVLDRLVIASALAAFFIRMGNLMNSEIVGNSTTLPWGFIFVQNGEDFARHPSQLYEAISSLLLFGTLFYLYLKTNIKNTEGKLFGLFLTVQFLLRFLYEFLKENQNDFDESIASGLGLNMGQMLSIPLVITGIYFLFRKK